jgi:small nuclear ribonucleoprotein (snRNP)-like protein
MQETQCGIVHDEDFTGYPVRMRDVKKGDYLKRSPHTNVVYVRGEFVRDGGWYDGKGRYSCQDFDDWNKEVFINGNKIVYIGFTF